MEFGAGSLAQGAHPAGCAGRPRAYTPIDISGDYLRDVARAAGADYPDLAAASRWWRDFTAPLTVPAAGRGARRAGFFPGSTIGNFRPDAAMALLRRMRDMLNGGGLLIGVDLVKDPALLHAAYNDAAGVTAAFNKNLLARANRELGADFDLDAFAHYAPYNPHGAAHRDVSGQPQAPERATLAAMRFDFAAGEAIHTEDSHKYTHRELPRDGGARPDSRPARCGPMPTGFSRSIGWKAASSGRHQQQRLLPLPEHGGRRIAEEQLLARPWAYAHHDHAIAIAWLPAGSLRPRRCAWRSGW